MDNPNLKITASWLKTLSPIGIGNSSSKWLDARKGNSNEAKDFRVDLIFSGGASSVSTSYLVVVQDAIVEASIKDRDFGFRKILQQDGFVQCQEKSLIIYINSCKHNTKLLEEILWLPHFSLFYLTSDTYFILKKKKKRKRKEKIYIQAAYIDFL